MFATGRRSMRNIRRPPMRDVWLRRENDERARFTKAFLGCGKAAASSLAVEQDGDPLGFVLAADLFCDGSRPGADRKPA
jgi:hypothetical protein